MKSLKVGDSPGLALPADDFIEAATGILGKRKRGKSGLERVIAEELLDAGLPFVWLDFVGIAWGLRSSADGKEKGYSILVVGGAHGDVPLDARAGADVARAIIKANVSVVVDLSKSTKGDWRRFVTEFCDTLYSENDTSRLVILDEASEFIPQRFRPDNAACFEAVERLVSRGRNQGLGVIIADQRPARVNKDVLSQVDYLICFGVSHPIDLKNLKEWVELQADPALMGEFTKGLAGLQPREAWCWNPELGVFQKFRVRDFKTLHPDKTHLRKIGMLKKKPITSDVSGVVDALSAVMAGFKAEKLEQKDAKAEVVRLRKRVAELEKGKPATAKAEVRVERVEVPVLTAEDRAVIREVGAAVREHREAIVQAQTALDGKVLRLVAVVERISAVEKRSSPPVVTEWIRADAARKTERAREKRDEPRDGDPGLDGGQRRVLEALARLSTLGYDRESKHAATGPQVAAWSKYTVGGRFNNVIGSLRGLGLVDKVNDGTLALTTEGRALAGEPEPWTQEEIQASVLARLDGGEQAVLKTLLAVYPEAVSLEELAARTTSPQTGRPYEVGGRFNNIRGRLRTMGLIEYTPDGSKAADFLFPEGA